MGTKYTIVDTCQIEPLAELYEKHIGYKTDGYFVDVGAFDGVTWSNAWGLADAGWGGLLVEPNLEFFEKCAKVYDGNPRVEMVNVAVGPYHGRARLYVGGSLSTLCRDTIITYRSIPELAFTGLDVANYVEVEVFTLDKLLAKFNILPGFDVLSVDVEGAEMDVLRGFSVDKYRPTMVIVETHARHKDERLSYKAIPVRHFLRHFGYEEVYANYINSIFVRM